MRFPWPLLWLSVACWSPKETGPRSMIGTLQAADGRPLSGVSVETVEARWTTDEEGRFAVNYKAPSQYLHLTWDEVWFKRDYRPEDEDRDVRIVLPEMSERTLLCETQDPCDAVLTWQLGDGLSARVRGRCDPEEGRLVATAPDGVPDEATCRTSATAPDTPLAVRPSPEGLRLSPPLVDLVIDLYTTHRVLPRTCAVQVDGEPVANTGEGTWRAKAWGRAEVLVSCDGIPATPRSFFVTGPATVEVPWTRDVPTLDLFDIAPATERILLMKRSGPNRGIRVPLPVDDKGRVSLPALDPGLWVVGIGTDWERVATTRLAEAIEPDRVHLVKLPPQVTGDAAGDEILGLIQASPDLDPGQLSTTWVEVPDPSVPPPDTTPPATP